jgi:hypothetical protein
MQFFVRGQRTGLVRKCSHEWEQFCCYNFKRGKVIIITIIIILIIIILLFCYIYYLVFPCAASVIGLLAVDAAHY